MTERQRAINPREIALDVLYEILEKDGYSHQVLSQALGKYQYLGKQDRGFITRVTEGTLEYLISIDYVLNGCSKTKTGQMKPLIRTLLRMSVYQLLYMDRVPDRAVCSEAVKLAEKRRFHGLKGFVNGVLRTISREKRELSFPTDSLRYGMPQWILDLWGKSYDSETIRRMLDFFLTQHPMTVRVRCGKDGMLAKQVLGSLQKQGVKVTECEYADSVLYLEQVDYPEALEAFQRGWIYVQDLSSVLAGLAASPERGDLVLDVCGAPGGKGLHMADLLQGTGHVEVRDISSYKVNLIKENIARLGLSNISASVWDAREWDETYEKKADIVIADLPCSGLGILGKKPDIKYRVSPEDLDSLAVLQRQILSVICGYVKPGGCLVYSTCTINRQENEENIAWFLEHYPFRPVDIEGRLGEKLKKETMRQGYIQLLPGEYPCDGFFLSVLQRI